MVRLFIIVLFFGATDSFSQSVLYQDVFQGGVTAGGFSTGMGVGNGTVQLHIEPGSTVRKAFLLSFSFNKELDSIVINNQVFKMSTQSIIFSSVHTNPYVSPICLHLMDISQWLQTNYTDIFNIEITLQTGMPFKGVFAPFFWIAYENNSLPSVNATLIGNSQNFIGNEIYPVSNLNVIDVNNPVGFSLYTDRTGSGNVPNIKVTFNSTLLGIVGGSDNVNNLWGGAGVKGHFYYQNNQLFGLDDDTPDAVMGGTDGLADVAPYLTAGSNSAVFKLENILFPNQDMAATSANLAYTLAYTTPCQPFNVTVSTDTMVCPEEQVQLHASGGQSYEWQPANGLSCTNCANPVLTADSSRLYTVRIWNNDSCSVVRPVMVRVRQKPDFQNVTHTNTACGETTGSIVVKPNTFHTYTLNGSPWQNNATFSNLDAGSYTIQIKDTNGCVNDSTVSIGSTLQTQALFTASPQSGTAPLSVAFTNQSTHATHYEWLINGQSLGNSLSSHTFDTSGTYTVTLIAYNYLPTCADTFSLTLSVADSLVLSIPNIFTPNQDGINDVFSVTSNLDTDYEFSVQNRWGNTMHTSKGKLLKSIPLVLWVGKDATDGVYFYQLKISGIPNREPIEKQGFVTMVR